MTWAYLFRMSSFVYYQAGGTGVIWVFVADSLKYAHVSVALS